jgi:hypothetical protein
LKVCLIHSSVILSHGLNCVQHGKSGGSEPIGFLLFKKKFHGFCDASVAVTSDPSALPPPPGFKCTPEPQWVNIPAPLNPMGHGFHAPVAPQWVKMHQFNPMGMHQRTPGDKWFRGLSLLSPPVTGENQGNFTQRVKKSV